MRIVEQFNSIQGEGKYVGTPSHFIRATGCNLRCEWKNSDGTTTKCDTPYTSWEPERGYELDIEKTLTEIVKSNFEHIILTGGEPTLYQDLSLIVQRCIQHGFFVTIETNGTKYQKIPHAFISISPKLKSSYPEAREAYQLHQKNNNFAEATKLWMQYNNYQLKFVINKKEDIEEVLGIQRMLSVPKKNIYLMPQGTSEEQLRECQNFILEYCLTYGFHYSPRLQINLFGNNRRK